MFWRMPVSLLLALLLAACNVNRGMHVEDGSIIEGGISSVNGALTIGKDCEIQGDVRNVNGAIRIGERTRTGAVTNTNGSITLDASVLAGEIRNTNGAIRVGSGSQIDGGIRTTNGAITLAAGTAVEGDVSTTNGRIAIERDGVVSGAVGTSNGAIRLTAARAGEISSRNGNIELLDGSRIEGKLHVRRSNGTSADRRTPQIIIGENVIVEGPLRFEREVKLYVHETATVGEISGAEPITFSGDQP